MRAAASRACTDLTGQVRMDAWVPPQPAVVRYSENSIQLHA
jgi:hypothetical protein